MRKKEGKNDSYSVAEVRGWMDGGWVDRRMGGWMDGWMDGGWMDGRISGWMDG